ncbi:MAG: GNAT family N-acetyltransferase [Chloroflexota bacterium]
MTVLTSLLQAESPQLRPLNILHDLPAVANLIEQCFANTMDAEGRSYLQQMRRSSQNSSFLRWAAAAVETVSMPLSGFVWEENGEIIGNVSLIPYILKRQRVYLIANIAVQPDCRRRGIGRALTLAAMQRADQRHADEVWLHVRDDNPGAIALYTHLGFQELARRTMWQAKPDRNVSPDGLYVNVAKRSARDWPQQEIWLRRLYPDLLTWYQPMPWRSLRPGLGPALYRFMMDHDVCHWTARIGSETSAVVSWQAMAGDNDRLWSAIPLEGSERALTALLLHVRRERAWRRTLTLDFPAGQYNAPIEAAGFHPHRTLLWMKLQPSNPVNHA